jgi:hypothetical protein
MAITSMVHQAYVRERTAQELATSNPPPDVWKEMEAQAEKDGIALLKPDPPRFLVETMPDIVLERSPEMSRPLAIMDTREEAEAFLKALDIDGINPRLESLLGGTLVEVR